MFDTDSLRKMGHGLDGSEASAGANCVAMNMQTKQSTARKPLRVAVPLHDYFCLMRSNLSLGVSKPSNKRFPHATFVTFMRVATRTLEVLCDIRWLRAMKHHISSAE